MRDDITNATWRHSNRSGPTFGEVIIKSIKSIDGCPWIQLLVDITCNQPGPQKQPNNGINVTWHHFFNSIYWTKCFRRRRHKISQIMASTSLDIISNCFLLKVTSQLPITYLQSCHQREYIPHPFYRPIGTITVVWPQTLRDETIQNVFTLLARDFRVCFAPFMRNRKTMQKGLMLYPIFRDCHKHLCSCICYIWWIRKRHNPEKVGVWQDATVGWRGQHEEVVVERPFKGQRGMEKGMMGRRKGRGCGKEIHRQWIIRGYSYNQGVLLTAQTISCVYTHSPQTWTPFPPSSRNENIITLWSHVCCRVLQGRYENKARLIKCVLWWASSSPHWEWRFHLVVPCLWQWYNNGNVSWG